MSRKRIESLWVLGIVLAASMAFQVEAETTELDAIDHGFYQIDDSPTAWNGFHNAVNTNYVARVSSATEQNRNFFVFDLSGVTEEIVGATLRIESVSTSASGNTYTLYDVETEIATLRTSHFETAAGAGNAEGRAIFEDLGTGLEYGSTQVTAVNALCNPNVFPGTDPQCPSFVEEIEFNAFGLAALNSATGLFAVGGRVNAGHVFASSGGSIGDFSVTLVLETATVLSAIDHGFYQIDDDPTVWNGFHNAVNTNYIARVASVTEQSRNFYVFDLFSFTDGIASATLRIESVSTSASGNTYTLYDVETEIATLRTSHFETAAGAGNAEGRAIFEDLGTGLEYGSTQVTAVNALCNPNVFPGTDPQCPSFVEEIEFNAFGLAALNSATGLFAVGGRINAGEVFASSGGNIGDFSVTLVLGASVNDTDADGISDGADNCPTAHNPFQDDHDEDGVGDVCDVDDDNDMVADVRDNCPLIPNTAQDDDDFDGLGNPCDSVFDSGNVVQYIEDVASTSVIDITNVNVPGGNGMIAKLTDSDGVVQRVGNAVSAFSADLIDAETYVLLLEDALKKLKAFENQLLAKIGNGKIADPEATNLLDNSAEMRGTIEDLIGAAGG